MICQATVTRFYERLLINLFGSQQYYTVHYLLVYFYICCWFLDWHHVTTTESGKFVTGKAASEARSRSKALHGYFLWTASSSQGTIFKVLPTSCS